MNLRKQTHTFISLIFIMVLVACNTPGQNLSSNQTSPLLELLGYIPDNETHRQWITYGDLSAWFDAWKIERPESGDVSKLESSDFNGPTTVASVLNSQTYIPQSFNVQYSLIEDQVGLLGFNFLTMDRFVEAGYPPNLLTIAEFSFDKAQIADSLTELGYQSDKTDDGILYSIRGDYEQDLNSPVKTLRFPNLNRILLTDGRMVIGSATDVVKNAQSAHADKISSLAENVTYVAMSHALEGDIVSDLGEMVGVILIDGSTLNNTINQRIQNGPIGQSETYFQHSLPGFDLAGFATYQKDKTSFLTLVLVFPKDTDARSAADILAERLQNYTTLDAKEPFKEWWSVENATVSSINSLPVAIVVMRSEAREFQGPLGSNLSVLPWSSLILRQDILFLKTGP